MRQENLRHVLSIINRRSSSRVELASETRLSQAAITDIVSELLDVGIIIEAGKKNGSTTMGRKQISLDVNPFWGYIIGINIEREVIEAGILSIDGNIVGKVAVLEFIQTPDDALDRIKTEVQNLIKINKIDPDAIIGLGAIVPGPFNAADGIILEPPFFESWHNYKLKYELERRFPYTVFVQHNASALTLLESFASKNFRFNTFALYTINIGIGFGLMLNGQVYAGTGNMNSEIGHTSVDINGRLCGCGRQGCLDMYASVRAVLHEAGRVKENVKSWRNFIDLVSEGDTFCNEILDLQARCLAHSILNLNNIIELNAVIITGLVVYRGELLLQRIKEHMHGKFLLGNQAELVIKKSDITENMGITAAAMLLIAQIFNDGLFAKVISQRKSEKLL